MSKETLEYVVAKAKEQKRQRNSSLRWKKILFQLMD